MALRTIRKVDMPIIAASRLECHVVDGDLRRFKHRGKIALPDKVLCKAIVRLPHRERTRILHGRFVLSHAFLNIWHLFNAYAKGMSNEYTARLSMHKTHGKTCCAALGQRRDGTNRRLFEDGTQGDHHIAPSRIRPSGQISGILVPRWPVWLQLPAGMPISVTNWRGSEVSPLSISVTSREKPVDFAYTE